MTRLSTSKPIHLLPILASNLSSRSEIFIFRYLCMREDESIPIWQKNASKFKLTLLNFVEQILFHVELPNHILCFQPLQKFCYIHHIQGKEPWRADLCFVLKLVIQQRYFEVMSNAFTASPLTIKSHYFDQSKLQLLEFGVFSDSLLLTN